MATEPMAISHDGAPVKVRGTQRRDALIMVALLVLFLAGLLGLAAATGWEETMAQIHKLSLLQLFALLGLSMVNYVMRGLRWHLFAGRLGLSTSLKQNMLHFFGGFAMSITPGRLGELVRLRWITRITNWSFFHVTPLPLADRAFDMAGMGLALAAGLFMMKGGVVGALPVAALAIVTAVLVTNKTLLSSLVESLWLLLKMAPRKFVRMRQAARSMGVFSAPMIALPGLALSIIGWIAEGFALYLLLVWLGAEINVASAVVIFIFATLAGGMTGVPGGLGGAEAAMVLLLNLQGVPLEVALPATAISRVTTLWFAVVLGLIAFPVAERISKRA